jgi:adenylyltransferase/sulfurtransferase
VLHNDNRIGALKVDSDKQSLEQLNPHASISTISRRLNDDQLSAEIAKHDLVLDASDNVATRNQLNRLCFELKVPLVSGAAIRMEGQISVFTYKDPSLPCYQCLSMLFGDSALSCVEAGVMSPVVGIIGATQALEAIKVLANFGTPKVGKLLLFDAATLSWREMSLPKSANCSVC